MPVSATLRGLPVLESVKTSDDALFPGLFGVKVRLAVQLELFVKVPVHVFAPSVNCVESPPVIATLVNVTLTPVLFWYVTTWAALARPE